MEEEIKQARKGRDSFLAKMKEKNPEYNPENDDQLWDDAHGMYEEGSGELSKYRDTNKRLADRILEDPRAGQFISEFAGEEKRSIPYAYGKVFGKEGYGLEGEDLEEFEKGYQESLAQLAESDKLQAEAMKNIEKSMADLDAYCKANGLDDAAKEALQDKGYDLADNILMGIFTEETWTLIDKGINYDKDVQDAVDTAMIEGKNQVIDNKKKSLKPDVIPNLGNGTGAGKTRPQISKPNGSFYDSVKKA